MIPTYRQLCQLIQKIEDDNVAVKKIDGDWYDNSSSSYFGTRPPSLTIGMRGDRESKIMALAHEYGHILTYRKGLAADMKTKMLYNWNVPLTNKQRQAILQEERDAFRLGFHFLRDNGITISPWMTTARKLLLGTHTKKLASLS